MKYYLMFYDHNSCISNGHELLFHIILLLMYVIIINVFQMDMNCILMFMIIHVFQKDFICNLIYYFNV